MKVSVSQLLAEKKPQIFSIHAQASVMEAVKEMNERRIGSLLIIDDGKLVGIFTERDVLCRVVVLGISAESTTVGEVMSKNIDTFHPGVTIDSAMAHMTETRHRHVPVVEGDEILGLVSIGDITRYLSRNAENEARNLLNYFTGTYHDS
tara:strand:+ start:3358 stop:3804 length:447 start_codon:yes stop_codon:yes gene_type:complete